MARARFRGRERSRQTEGRVVLSALVTLAGSGNRLLTWSSGSNDRDSFIRNWSRGDLVRMIGTAAEKRYISSLARRLRLSDYATR